MAPRKSLPLWVRPARRAAAGARHSERQDRRVRRARDHARRELGEGHANSPRSAPRSSRADVDDVESLKRRSPAPTAPSASRSSGSTSRPRRRSPRPRNMAEAAKARGRAARHLVHARGHAQVDAARATTACRRCRASTRCRTSTARARRTSSSRDLGVPTTFLLTSFYWDNFIYFGAGPKKGRTASWRSRCRWATRSCRASRPRTSASARYGDLQGGPRVHRQDGRASPAST